VLLAIRFTLGSIWAWLEVALIQGWSRRVLVVVMAIHLLLRWPAILVIFARFDWALPWSRVCLLVLGQITRAFEFFVTARFTAAFGSKLSCRSGALAASHRAQDRFVLFCFFAQRSLEANGVFAVLVEINWLSSCDGNGLSVLLNSDELSWATVLVESTVKSDFVGSEEVSMCW
jgi:hypothetical protein